MHRSICATAKHLYIVFSLTSCNGELTTTLIDPVTLQPVAANISSKHVVLSVEGVIAYRPIRVLEVYQFTQFDPGDKKPLSSGCSPPPLNVRKIASVADTAHPLQVKYSPGLLEASEFGATMNADGILLAVNNKSTPDQGKTIENLTSAAANVASMAGRVSPSTTQPPDRQDVLCNATPSFLRYEPAPSLPGGP